MLRVQGCIRRIVLEDGIARLSCYGIERIEKLRAKAVEGVRSRTDLSSVDGVAA